jgi:hypothetical protein
MRKYHCNSSQESGVSGLIEYIIISGILMVLLVITLLVVNNVFIENPSNQLTYYAFTDIGNGVSTRIVDLYVLTDAPYTTGHIENITSAFDIPDDVAGRSYLVTINGSPGSGQGVDITGGSTTITVSLGGIGSSLFGGASGKTTGAGMNKISYISNLT